MLTRLETKGHLKHREDGLRYVYSATTSPSTASRKALKQHLGTFFGGSISEMAAALLREEKWTDEELDNLEAEIQRIKKERKRS
jgi:predicted transcriptional regulator